MKMNLNQTKIVGLTMELDLKAREYKRLCEEVEKLEKANIDENDEKFLYLKKLFEENQAEIEEINKKLEELNMGAKVFCPKEIELGELPNYLSHNIGETNSRQQNTETSLTKQENGLLRRIMQKIKKILNK